jgi:hypothetical protein
MSFVWVRTGGDRSLCAIERSRGHVNQFTFDNGAGGDRLIPKVGKAININTIVLLSKHKKEGRVF